MQSCDTLTMSDTKTIDVTARCEHCGGLKKEHHKRAPFKCPTRLSENNWKPWTEEGYEEATRESREKAAAEEAARILARTCQFCRVIHKALVPTVHMNGTSAHELRGQLDAAIEALREARQKLVQAAPNGRDYYPQPGNMVEVATGQHERRCQSLNDMISDLEEQRDHVQAVIDFQTEQRQEVR